MNFILEGPFFIHYTTAKFLSRNGLKSNHALQFKKNNNCMFSDRNAQSLEKEIPFINMNYSNTPTKYLFELNG